MGVKLSDLTTETAPASNDILMIADPITGVAKKLTVSALKTLLDGLGGGTDTTAPTIVSAIANTASSIQITFSEPVVLTTAGWSFKKNGVTWSVNTASGSGNVWTFNMATSGSAGDTILRSYSSSTGNTVDTSSNELVTFTDAAVTNSIPSGYQAETTAFESALTALSSTMTTAEKNAIDALVVEFKAIGWNKFQAIYPFVGSNLSGSYMNLRNPANTNGAFRISASGGASTLSNGLSITNTTILDTNFNYNTGFADLNSIHAFYAYSGASTNSAMGVGGGAYGGGGLIVGARWDDLYALIQHGGDQQYTTKGGTAGDIILSRTGSGNSNCKAYIDGNLLVNDQSTPNESVNANIYLGRLNAIAGSVSGTAYGNQAAAQKLLLATIGTGLTGSEITAVRTAWTNFKTALSR